MSKIILHRGQYNGIDETIANNPKHIKSIIKDYDCEVDLWRKDKKLFLGHDYPKYLIDLDFLVEYRKKLWIHAKDTEALEYLINIMTSLNYFWHEEDKHTLTSLKFIWQADYDNLTSKTIVVDTNTVPRYNAKCYAICVDYRE